MLESLLTVRDAIAAAAARLAGVGDTPRLDAELLMAHALGTSREDVLLFRLGEAAPAGYEPLVERRLAHEPIAYITGRRAFWTIELEVGPGVLIPRPDSETLIEATVEHFAGTPGPARILDLGTGSGALLLAALDQWPLAQGVGLDESADAIRIARANVRRLGMRSRARIRPGGWTGWNGPYDLILCNPPYVATGERLPAEVAAFEPAGALFAGRDGLDDYRMIAPVLAPQLAPGGVACVEIGASQAASAGALFIAVGLAVRVRNDLSGRPRCLVVEA